VYGARHHCYLGLGYKFILKYRHNKYQLFRTLSVMFFQLGFAFSNSGNIRKLNPEKPILQKI
jgi:hypothetical protein